MGRKLYIKRYVIAIVIVLFIFLVLFFSVNYVINNNSDYNNNLVKKVSNKYNGGNIDNVNIYGGYYIVSYKDKIIVLDKEYKEIYKENTSKLADNEKGYDIVYKTNKLMYEETVVDDETLTYNYYDIHSYKLVNSIDLK